MMNWIQNERYTEYLYHCSSCVCVCCLYIALPILIPLFLSSFLMELFYQIGKGERDSLIPTLTLSELPSQMKETREREGGRELIAELVVVPVIQVAPIWRSLSLPFLICPFPNFEREWKERERERKE